MFVTFDVLRPLRFRDFNDVQPKNISSMVVTLDALRPLRSRDFNEAQS